jgi:hypothetical protein
MLLGWTVIALCSCSRQAQPETPLLEVVVPAGYAHETVILVSDPSSRQELVWHDGKARLVVPKSGVVRLKTLGLIDGHLFEAQLNGRNYWSFGVTNLNGHRIADFNFSEAQKERPLDLMSEAELARFIHDRETEQ